MMIVKEKYVPDGGEEELGKFCSSKSERNAFGATLETKSQSRITKEIIELASL